MDDGLRISPRVLIPERELSWRFSRSGGAGGQHVNTSDTRVELMYDVAASTALSNTARARALQRLGGKLVDGVLTVVASERRSQLQNREAARERLAAVLAEAIAPPPKTRRPTRPSKGAVERRIGEKKRRGETKRLRRSDPD
ncbi:MAG TPA: alternative ribosome rescue aminoacyl-tRNA hydrolase ArfB [Mycobacteriales bacterium]|nr:alternative ribosome rescue aminoacyl-tRNA hydrolase ArfB [Mycobacteriales bacterium]